MRKGAEVMGDRGSCRPELAEPRVMRLGELDLSVSMRLLQP